MGKRRMRRWGRRRAVRLTRLDVLNQVAEVLATMGAGAHRMAKSESDLGKSARYLLAACVLAEAGILVDTVLSLAGRDSNMLAAQIAVAQETMPGVLAALGVVDAGLARCRTE